MAVNNGLRNFLDRFFGTKDRITINAVTASGTAETWYYELAIKTAVSLIANVIGKCEFKTYYNNELNDKSVEYYRWNVAPNKNQNASEFKHRIIEELLLTGECLVVEVGNELFVADGFSKETDGVKPYVFNCVSVEGVQLNKKFKRSDVLYYKLDGFELNPLLSSVCGSYIDAWATAFSNYKQKNASKWKLKISSAARADKRFAETYQQLTQQNLKQFFEKNNAVYPEYDGYELTEVAGSGTAASDDITKLRNDIFALVAQTYKTPVSLLSGQIAGVKDVFESWLSVCIEPITTMLTDENNKQLYTFEDWQSDNFMYIDTSNVKHIDFAALSTAIEKCISSGSMNVDEVRTIILGLNALNTEASTRYYITKNFEALEAASEKADDQPTTDEETGKGVSE